MRTHIGYVTRVVCGLGALSSGHVLEFLYLYTVYSYLSLGITELFQLIYQNLIVMAVILGLLAFVWPRQTAPWFFLTGLFAVSTAHHLSMPTDFSAETVYGRTGEWYNASYWGGFIPYYGVPGIVVALALPFQAVQCFRLIQSLYLSIKRRISQLLSPPPTA